MAAQAFWALVEKYFGDQCTQSHIVANDVEHLTGKVAKEYVSSRHRIGRVVSGVSANTINKTDH